MELADNAPNTDGCSITPAAVSPRVQHVNEQGDSPVIAFAPGAVSESNWESMEPISKRAVIKESENEVLVVGARRPWIFGPLHASPRYPLAMASRWYLNLSLIHI